MNNEKHELDENKEFKYDEKRHEFQARHSYLDIFSAESEISKSKFIGFYNLFFLCSFIIVISKPIFNYYKYGYIFKTGLFYNLFLELETLITVYPIFYLWSYLAFILQMLIKKKIIESNLLILIYQHSSQSGVFLLTTYFCLRSNMCVTHMMFTVVQCFIHFFKMHSYTEVNLEYRNIYLQTNKDKDSSNKSKTSNNDKALSYPNNITLKNFAYFLHIPTFIYRPHYPQTTTIRLKYLLLNSYMAFLILACLYYIYTEWMEPVIIEVNNLYILEAVYLIYFPMLLFILLGFFLVFEFILNSYAELTYFADREFYKDWWNSTDFEEFNRKWNKIVYEFLYQHVFLALLTKYKFKLVFAKIITILFSSVLHEFAICIVLRLIFPFMILLMCSQFFVIPITKKLMSKTTFGNYFVWFNVNLGVCLMFVFYNRAYANLYTKL